MRAATIRNGVLIGLSFAAGAARADELAVFPPAQYCPPTYPVPLGMPWMTPGATPGANPGAAPGTAPQTPGATPPGAEAAAPPETDMLAERGGTGAAGTSIPTMYGDQLSGSSSSSSSNNLIQQIFRGQFKVSENESPAPMDRVYLTYNFYDNVLGKLNSGPQTNVHRETAGFEKTFLDGNASVELRVPILETNLSSSDESGIGDLTMIFKYAVYNNKQTGDVISGGLALTVPTARDFVPAGASQGHPILFQPWVGSIMNYGDFFVQGFTSVVVPNDSGDATELFSDVGIGYFLYRNCNPCSLITAVIPTAELHNEYPFNHHGAAVDSLGGLDSVSITTGATLEIHQRSQLNIGVNVPISGPKPYDIEALVQFNWKF